jgi:phosphate transport system substrate-binding protein
VRSIPIAASEGGQFFDATPENSLAGNYPLARFLYVYVNKAPNSPLPIMESEFLKLILSKVGQGIVLKDGYIPLPARVVEGVLGSIGI